MATHSSILAWKIPWTEEPGRYSPWGHKESDVTERLHFHFHRHFYGAWLLNWRSSPLPTFRVLSVVQHWDMDICVCADVHTGSQCIECACTYGHARVCIMRRRRREDGTRLFSIRNLGESEAAGTGDRSPGGCGALEEGAGSGDLGGEILHCVRWKPHFCSFCKISLHWSAIVGFSIFKDVDLRRRNDASKLWCWRRLFRVSWTTRRSNQSILSEISPDCSWKDWYWSWNSNTSAAWGKELTHWKRPWCWERLRAGRKWDDRGWDTWMVLLT